MREVISAIQSPHFNAACGALYSGSLGWNLRQPTLLRNASDVGALDCFFALELELLMLAVLHLLLVPHQPLQSDLLKMISS